MWLVLCASNDPAALWAWQGLKARGLEPLELVTAEALDLGAHWEHRVGTGRVSSMVTLADGRRIRDDEVWGALNRLSDVPLNGLALIRPADQEYVRQELRSFFLSWLASLPGAMLNRPTAWGMSGRWRHISEWIVLATQAGLPVPAYGLSSRDLSAATGWPMRAAANGAAVTLLITVGDAVVGAPAPPAVAARAVRLAELAETALLGVEFVVGQDGRWVFAGAVPQPDLRLGGEALLDALALALRNGREVGR